MAVVDTCKVVEVAVLDVGPAIHLVHDAIEHAKSDGTRQRELDTEWVEKSNHFPHQCRFL